MPTLQEILNDNVREGTLYETLEENKVRCYACGHECPIPDGRPGVCKIRYNEGGKLYVPWGYVSGLQCDPIEKKPFFHAYPGGLAYSFGMLGCDLHCAYCQNWVTSQALRDPSAVVPPHRADPEAMVRDAVEQGARAMVSTYNEPLITSEWAVAVFKEARGAGLATGYVSNGNATPQVLEYLRPWLDLFKVDLKSFNPANYRKLGAQIDPILESIRRIYEMGFWTEIVTLVVPGFNDSDDELRQIADFLVAISPDIPWHVTAFHKNYKMTDPANTDARTLERAAEIGTKAGLALCLRRKSTGKGERSREYALSGLPRGPHRAPRLSDPVLQADARRTLSLLQHVRRGALGPGVWWAEGFLPVFTAQTIKLHLRTVAGDTKRHPPEDVDLLK